MSELIIDWSLQLLQMGSLILLPALALYAANEAWYRSFGRAGHKIELSTGLVGVPIHELSHAIFVVLFGMSVTEVALFKPDPQSKSLGYVNYRYQKGSIWHSAGRFFVGIAPLIGGGLVVYLLLWSSGLPLLHEHLSSNNIPQGFWLWVKVFVVSIDTPIEVGAIILCIMVSSHATPSRADMRGAAGGVFGLVLVYMGFHLIMALIPKFADAWIRPYVDLKAGVLHVAALITQMATLGVLFSSLLALVTFGLNRLFGSGGDENDKSS